MKKDEKTPKIDQLKEDELFDMHEDMQTVDDIPTEELNEQVKDEKNKDKTKDTSSSEEKYR